MKIALGSTNPGKIIAVKTAVKKVWKNAEVLPVDVDSGVGHTPPSQEEAIQGATNRAKLSQKKSNADYGVGIEGFIIEINGNMFTEDWAVVVDQDGNKGLGMGGFVMLPEKIAQDVRKGVELTVSLDKNTEFDKVGKKQGAIGVFTNNIVTRRTSMESAVIKAFARFITPEYYD